MPVMFYRYGCDAAGSKSSSPAEQAALTFQEFLRQKAIGMLPADALDGGFFGDTIGARAVKFLHRTMGIHLAMLCRPGDRICVSSFPNLILSSVDAGETLEWALSNKIDLVILDQQIDTSTVHGLAILRALISLKSAERSEHGRRSRQSRKERAAAGLATGPAPLGFKSRTIIPIGGCNPRKYLFPWPEERQYGAMIARMHDEMGLSFHTIAVKLWLSNRPMPRSGKAPSHRRNVWSYYHAHKNGWPLPNGEQWAPPDFRFRFSGRRRDVTDLNRTA